jgi:hypothetical protein
VRCLSVKVNSRQVIVRLRAEVGLDVREDISQSHFYVDSAAPARPRSSTSSLIRSGRICRLRRAANSYATPAGAHGPHPRIGRQSATCRQLTHRACDRSATTLALDSDMPSNWIASRVTGADAKRSRQAPCHTRTDRGNRVLFCRRCGPRSQGLVIG